MRSICSFTQVAQKRSLKRDPAHRATNISGKTMMYLKTSLKMIFTAYIRVQLKCDKREGKV